MIENFLNFFFFQISWWQWVVIGILLTIAEIFVLGFFILWFGVSAIIVGVVSFFIELTLSSQIVAWAVLSAILLWVWFGLFQKSKSVDIGQSDEYRDISGEIREKLENRRYRAYFDLPILGDRSWIVESDENLEIGDKIRVDKVFGQILRVKKIEKE